MIIDAADKLAHGKAWPSVSQEKPGCVSLVFFNNRRG
jgi:hypothetical protein